MAVTYGFYDSLNHDRLYNAQQMSAIFDGIINDGVFMSVGNQFHTVAGTGMQVIVKSGRAWFDSTWTLNDAEYPLSIDAADVLLTRIDAVVLEVNSEVATRANTIKIVKGTPASTPAKPTLTNTATIHQHALAYVTVAKNITAITNSMIEIVVGKTETPYVTAILQTTDITDLFNQWEDYFQTWFDTVRGTLDGDVALNLQNQITSLRRETLKNTTPPIIGLPASATPDDMFQALGNTGELHVWRKTMVTDKAGYNLGSPEGGFLASGSGENNNNIKFTVYYSSSISVSDVGEAVLVSPENITYAYNSGNSSGFQQRIRGKFIKIEPQLYVGYPQRAHDGLMFIPTDATLSYTTSGTSLGYPYNYCYIVDKMQIVQPHGVGTTSTYPVSTNPNAYQEGSNAKPAGYVLGDVKTGQFAMNIGSDSRYFKYASSVVVSDDGNVSLSNPSNDTYVDFPNVRQYAKGKFIMMTAKTNNPYMQDLIGEVIYWIPNDITVTTSEKGIDGIWINKYQEVTGYAAIPAGTTIEYLGKLGDKARVQFGSYVGTGTYGSSNPNTLTFDFVPKMVFVWGFGNISGNSLYYQFMFYGENYTSVYIGDTNNKSTRVSWDSKTVSWYTGDRYKQLNESSRTYRFFAIC